MTGRPRRAATVGAALLVAAGSGGCGGDSELVHLRVAFTRHLTMSPLFITEAEGFFEEQGLDVELIALESASVGMPSLLQGRLDVLPGPVSTAAFNAIHRGGRVRLVADKGRYRRSDCSHNAFVISHAARPGEGRPIIARMSTAKEHFNQFFVERALEANGYDPSTVEMYHVPQAAEYDALLAGRLDAAFVGEPWLSRVRARGGAEIRTPTNDLFDGYQYSVFLFGPRLLDDDPELGERFMMAMLKGMHAYNEGATPRNLQILGDIMGLDREELEGACWPTMGTDGYVDLPSLVAFQEWAVARGDQDAVVPIEDFWDPRFVEGANRRLDAAR
jgi:NitT/TauT family transport system substrate-binding protein